MLPKSSQRVGEVIRLANQIARDDEQEYVGTEHVLLAILREGTGIGATALVKHGITMDALRKEITRLMKERMEETWVFGRLPGTPHFRNVMSAAIRQCKKLGAAEVCTEHILLALYKERGCVAQQALSSLDLSYDQLRQTVAELSKSR